MRAGYPVYALKEFTVEHRPRGWFYWRTYGDKAEAKGPYSSLESVTLMIARELKREVTARRKRVLDSMAAMRAAADRVDGGGQCGSAS